MKHQTRTVLEDLKDFLDEDSGRKIRLAVALGYTTTTTIDQWFSRGAIPQREVERVTTHMKEEKRK